MLVYMKSGFFIGLFVGVGVTLLVGFKRLPEQKLRLQPDVHYSWLTASNRRIDLSIEDEVFNLHVASHDQERAFFQVIVVDDQISTHHSLHYGTPVGDRENGVNLNSDAGEITNFTCTLNSEDSIVMLRDTNNDLHFDQLLEMGENPRKKTITYNYSQEPNSSID